MRWVWVAVICTCLCTPAWAERGEDTVFLQGELYTSVLTETDEGARLANAFGGSIKAGRRWGRWGVFGQIEQSAWRSPGVEEGEFELYGALNIGPGGEVLFADGLARTSVAVGLSMLNWSTPTDEAWQKGVFLDVRPGGFRFEIDDRWLINVDPISFTLLMPALDGIPLVEFEYRTTIVAEYTL
ncbi:MAG: hypothetical protein ACE366_18910 [Bradymonadia bacterium]